MSRCDLNIGVEVRQDWLQTAVVIPFHQCHGHVKRVEQRFELRSLVCERVADGVAQVADDDQPVGPGASQACQQPLPAGLGGRLEFAPSFLGLRRGRVGFGRSVSSPSVSTVAAGRREAVRHASALGWVAGEKRTAARCVRWV